MPDPFSRLAMRDFFDLDREAARGRTGWLWSVAGRWTAGGSSCGLARNGYGDLVPTSSVADGRVRAALDSGAWVVAATDGADPNHRPVAVRKAGTPPRPRRVLTPADFMPTA